MKQFKLAASIFLSALLFSSAANAFISLEDVTTPVDPAAPYNWTGFYGGLNLGAMQHTMNITDTDATTFYATLQQVSNPKITGGFQIGYRRQLDFTKTSGVYGAEFSTNFSNATFNKQYGSSFALYQLSAKNELQNLCLLQLIGGIAAERTFLFVAAGLSWVNISGNVTNLDSVPFFNSFNVSKKALGTSVGAGVEYAYNEVISLRLKVDYIIPNTYSTLDNNGDSFQISNNIVQTTLGINYKFG